MWDPHNLLKKTKARTESWLILRTAGKQRDFWRFSHNLAQVDKIVGFARHLEIQSTR
jgi:hypothetical protein